MTTTYLTQEQKATAIEKMTSYKSKSKLVRTSYATMQNKAKSKDITEKTASVMLDAHALLSSEKITDYDFDAAFFDKNIKSVEKFCNTMTATINEYSDKVDIHTALCVYNLMQQDDKTLSFHDLRASQSLDIVPQELKRKHKRANYGISTANAQTTSSVQLLVALKLATASKLDDKLFKVTLTDDTAEKKALIASLLTASEAKIKASHRVAA